MSRRDGRKEGRTDCDLPTGAPEMRGRRRRDAGGREQRRKGREEEGGGLKGRRKKVDRPGHTHSDTGRGRESNVGRAGRRLFSGVALHQRVHTLDVVHRTRREAKQRPSGAKSRNQISCCFVSLPILSTYPEERTGPRALLKPLSMQIGNLKLGVWCPSGGFGLFRFTPNGYK